MIRRNPLIIRGVIALTAISTIWCLGCSAFSSLLSCAGSMDMDQPAVAAVTAATGYDLAMPLPANTSNDDCACCISCYAVEAHAVLRLGEVALPDRALMQVSDFLAEFSQPPLVPPPQQTA